MAYVEDIAASVSSSLSNALSSLKQLTFGNKNVNFGGTLNATNSTRNEQDSDTASEARAVSSTAKAGDGGVASSSAALTEGLGNALSSLDIKTVIIGELALVAAVLAWFGFRNRRKTRKTKK